MVVLGEVLAQSLRGTEEFGARGIWVGSIPSDSGIKETGFEFGSSEGIEGVGGRRPRRRLRFAGVAEAEHGGIH